MYKEAEITTLSNFISLFNLDVEGLNNAMRVIFASCSLNLTNVQRKTVLILCNGDTKSFEQASRVLGISYGRVIQIFKDARRKLLYHSYRKEILKSLYSLYPDLVKFVDLTDKDDVLAEIADDKLRKEAEEKVKKMKEDEKLQWLILNKIKEDEKLTKIESLSIDTLDLNTRSCNCLKSVGINLIGDLLKYSESSLLQIRNLGRHSLNEIKNVLASRGFQLAKE